MTGQATTGKGNVYNGRDDAENGSELLGMVLMQETGSTSFKPRA